MPRKTVVLFDWDGTLLDTTELVKASTRHALSQVLGRTVSDETLRPYFGRTLEDQFRGLVPDADPATLDRLLAAYRTHNRLAHDARAVPRPGAVAVIAALRAAGLGLGVVSSKRRVMLDRGIALLGLETAFATVISMESTVRHKPHPDPIDKALETWPEVPRSQVAMVGDSPYDMEAAVRAGVDAVGVLSNTFTRDELRRAGARVVLDHLLDLLDWLELARQSDTGGGV